MARDDDRITDRPSSPDDRFDDDVEQPHDPHRLDIRREGLNRGQLRNIAQFQKVVLVCILAYILAVVFQFALPQELRLFLGLGFLGVMLVAAIFVCLLAFQLYSPAWAIVLSVLFFIPCVGLIVLLVINSKATDTLKKHSIRVGLLGARLSDLNE